MIDILTPRSLAIYFHDMYERLAPHFGYETRPDTKQFDPNTPNGKLMLEVCQHVLHEIYDKAPLGSHTALLNALYGLGGGDVYMEEFGRLCFCPAHGKGQRHATACDDAWQTYQHAVAHQPEGDILHGFGPDNKGREWHLLKRKNGSVSIYYTLPNVDANYIVYDSMDTPKQETR